MLRSEVFLYIIFAPFTTQSPLPNILLIYIFQYILILCSCATYQRTSNKFWGHILSTYRFYVLDVRKSWWFLNQFHIFFFFVGKILYYTVIEDLKQEHAIWASKHHTTLSKQCIALNLALNTLDEGQFIQSLVVLETLWWIIDSLLPSRLMALSQKWHSSVSYSKKNRGNNTSRYIWNGLVCHPFQLYKHPLLFYLWQL